jgi:NHLM bacteriocin system ABC transporter peptidase/ATP-binding protein
MGLVLLLNGALTWLREYYLLRLQTKLALSTSSRFLWHVLRLPIQFFMQRYAGEIGARVALNDAVAQWLSGELAARAISLVTVVFFAWLMFQYDVGLTLIGILIVILNMAALSHFSRKRRDEQQRLLQEKGKLVGTAMSGLRTIESIKASGTEADFFTRWAGYHAKTLNAQQSLSIYSQLLTKVPTFLAGVNTAAILGLGSLRVMTGQMSIGELVAFQLLMASFVAPFTGLVNLGSQFQELAGALNRLDDVLHHDLDSQFTEDDPIVETDESRLKLMGYLEIKNLTFGYSRLAPALIEDFSLNLKPGSRVALVGDTGSGKSTIARVVAGLYVPWAGEIRFDGQPRPGLPRSLINNSLALVDQDIFLFEGTVRENITLWDPSIPETDIIRAAKDAHIHDVIAARPGGYDSLIIEGGRNFSGGQRQRLELARALAINPTLLILDEATSALDPTTEKLIDENIRRRGCTCLIIAHRLSTIRDCDEIIVLQQGRVVERGTHEPMRRAKGPYARLIQVGLTKEDGMEGQKAEALLTDLAAKLKK